MKKDQQKLSIFLRSILLAAVLATNAFAQAQPADPNTKVAQPPASVTGPAPTTSTAPLTPQTPEAARPPAPTGPQAPAAPQLAPALPPTTGNSQVAPIAPAAGQATQPAQGSQSTAVTEVITVTTTTQSDGTQAKSVYAKPFRKLFALVKTDFGSFRIALQPNQKPITVENFVRLAEGSKATKDLKSGRISFAPFYDGLTFHRAIRGTLIQTGCPYGDGRGGPGHTIQDESNEFDTVEEGSVLMARASSKAKNSAGSQFYIMLRPLPDLTDQDTIFGKVIEGLDVVRKISEVKVDRTDRPINPVKIISITIQKE
ncbi:MAG: peptidylprolyl isomerase [Bdellovibrionales bacterium]|nr:peptidylprolyl isomerase [Bdellovibrionales bacterium]